MTLAFRLGTGARLRSVAGLLLLLAAMLPLQIYRAGLESSWWVDENESVLLASGPVARIFDYTASDTNPPGYFLALKPWLALGRVLPGERGVLWARMPSILVWTLLAVFLWTQGRALFGPVPGAALAWAVCASGYAGWFTDARGFGISSAAVLACGLLLCGLVRAAAAEPPRRGTAWTWLVYALCAEVALWTHLTSIVALGLLGGIWLAMAWRLRARAPWLLRHGLVAHAAAVLAYSPWLLRIGHQIAARRNENAWWVTPANLKQWLFVFFRWYPLGDAGLPLPAELMLGVLALLVPLAAALAVARRRRRSGSSPETRFLAAAAAFSLAFAVAFTSALWSLQRFFGISVFHAPRYPCLALGFWALGLALLAAWAASREGWRPGTVWLLLAPWLLAGGLCLTGELRQLRVSVFENPRERHRIPPPGATLFVMPPALIPFTRHLLGAWRIRPATELPCALADMDPEGEAWVLDLNFLNMLEDWQDTVLLGAINEDGLARRVQAHRMPVPQYYTLYRLRSLRSGRAQKICAQGGLRLRPAPLPIPPSAAAVALPELQSLHDGWWWPEVGRDLAYRRWWSRPRTRLVFDRSVPAGDYVLHYRGLCPGHEKEPADLGFRIAGSSLDLHLRHQAGEVEVDVPFHLDGPDRKPVLLLAHTMESTNAIGRSDMPINQVGSTLRYAWLERRLERRGTIADRLLKPARRVLQG